MENNSVVETKELPLGNYYGTVIIEKTVDEKETIYWMRLDNYNGSWYLEIPKEAYDALNINWEHPYKYRERFSESD